MIAPPQETHNAQLAAQASQLGELKQQFAELRELNLAMQVALMTLEAKDSRVAALKPINQ